MSHSQPHVQKKTKSNIPTIIAKLTIIEKFINQTIASDVGTWSVITSFDVHDLATNNITLFINGLKIDEAAVSVADNGSNTSEITFKQIDTHAFGECPKLKPSHLNKKLSAIC